MPNLCEISTTKLSIFEVIEKGGFCGMRKILRKSNRLMKGNFIEILLFRKRQSGRFCKIFYKIDRLENKAFKLARYR